MAAMSRNSSSNSLMGFTVHQPAIGAALQFFPAMGSKQLDEMIDAYVAGPASISDKRAVVSMEFFEHTIQTGDLFKFFPVYPAFASATASPASSSTMQDSGYGSSFDTSPVISESQWASNSSFTTSPNIEARSAPKKTTSPSSRARTNDFSHLPGMKILTKDGQDVTNSATRGCKTKEQRDHAHMMRIMKACPECRRKKQRCDPSHKRSSSSESKSADARVTKKAKKTTAPPAQKVTRAAEYLAPSIPVDTAFSEALLLENSFAVAPENWEQFIAYDEEPADVLPLDYDFFNDPQGYFSPAASNSASISPTQSHTPAQPVTPTSAQYDTSGIFNEGQAPVVPTLPYLNSAGIDVGNNYIDFNLYSPESSFLDEDPTFYTELAAAAGPKNPDYAPSHSRALSPISRYSENNGPADTRGLILDHQVNVALDHVFSNDPPHHLFPPSQIASRPGGVLRVEAVEAGQNHQRLFQDLRDGSRAMNGAYSAPLAGPLRPGTLTTSSDAIAATSSVSSGPTLVNQSAGEVSTLPVSQSENSSGNQHAPTSSRESSLMVLIFASRFRETELTSLQGHAQHASSTSLMRTRMRIKNDGEGGGFDFTEAMSGFIHRDEAGSLQQQSAGNNELTRRSHAVHRESHQSHRPLLKQQFSNTSKTRQRLIGTTNTMTTTTTTTTTTTITTMTTAPHLSITDIANKQDVHGQLRRITTNSSGPANVLRDSTVAPPQNNTTANRPPSQPVSSAVPGHQAWCTHERVASRFTRSSAIIATNGKSAVESMAYTLAPTVALASSAVNRPSTTEGLVRIAMLAVTIAILAVHAWSLASNPNQGLMSTVLIALSLVATQQDSASCMNKLGPFMQALGVARAAPRDVINNFKSKIQGFSREVSNIQCKGSLSYSRRAMSTRVTLMT